MEWIQCKDEMPPITTDDCPERYLVNCGDWTYVAIMGSKYFHEYGSDMKLIGAVEWMPLPTPSNRQMKPMITNDQWVDYLPIIKIGFR